MLLLVVARACIGCTYLHWKFDDKITVVSRCNYNYCVQKFEFEFQLNLVSNCEPLSACELHLFNNDRLLTNIRR